MSFETTVADGYLISDDKDRLDIGLVHRFIAEESYWAKGRPRALVERTIAGSLCLGVYAPAGGQVGFARVITDRALFAWMADVFVLPEARGKGLGKAMVAAFLDHPDLADVSRWMLVTSDADKLYEGFGFTWVAPEDRLMKRIGARAAAGPQNSSRTP
jgi:N-acetylglutamate synthase-like GNAT family acetyltransferase